MTRIALAVLVLAGCATPRHDVPVPSAAVGMKRLATASSRSLRRQPVAQLLTVTGYCYTGSRNAAGQWPSLGTAAANAYPLGARLDVEGYGVVTVEDRSAVGTTDVDLYLGTDSGCEARAIAWGRRLLHVTEIR